MFVWTNSRERWSRIAFYAMVASFSIAIISGVGDPLAASLVTGMFNTAVFWHTLFYNLRMISTEMLYGFIILFAAAKFFETRTIFTIGFDNLDTDKIAMKGPDESNIVWIGRRYGSKFEADTVAAAISERLKDSAA